MCQTVAVLGYEGKARAKMLAAGRKELPTGGQWTRLAIGEDLSRQRSGKLVLAPAFRKEFQKGNSLGPKHTLAERNYLAVRCAKGNYALPSRFPANRNSKEKEQVP